MNKHIELVERYSADNDSVSIQELHANFDSAADASDAACAALSDAIDTCKAACNVVNALEVIVDAAFAADMEAADALVAAQKAFFQKDAEGRTLYNEAYNQERTKQVNSHIELVKRYLAGEDVTTEELRANSVDARAAWVNAKVYADASGTARAALTADSVSWAAAHAATYAATYPAAAPAAAYWVKRYEELSE